MKAHETSASRSSKLPLLKDFSWYMLSAFLPMAVGFVKTPVFTRYFSPAEFGELGLVQITFSFLGMLLFSWIASCLWRYYPKYSKAKELPGLYSNLLLLFGAGGVLSLAVSLGWYFTAASALLRNIVFYSFFYLIFSQLLQLYMVVVRLEAKAKFYTLFQTFRAITSLGLALYLVFYLGQGIESLVSSMALVELLLLVFLLVRNPSRIHPDWARVDGAVLRSLLQYGGVGLVLNLSLLAITYSDRYVILLFEGIQEVGIYDQVYKIAQLSVMALTTVFFNTINPTLLNALEESKKGSLSVSASYMRLFALWGLPLITYLSIYAHELSNLLLGEEFRSAYTLMPFIFWGTYLLGFVNFYELRMKFDNSFKKLVTLGLGIALVNLLLNLVFISLYDYRWAAYTTLGSYLLLLILAHLMEPGLSKAFYRQVAWLPKLMLILLVQSILYFVILKIYEPGIVFRIALGIIFVLFYTGLMRKELLSASFNQDKS